MLICFFVYQPDYSDKRALSIFNTTIVGLTAFLSMIAFFWVKNTYAHTIYKDWWFFSAVCLASITGFLLLVIGWITRAWLFRSKAQNHFEGW